VSLIGYTNAGKTTLLNTLAKTNYLEEDKLFATLDPITKLIKTKKEKLFLLTDTVGFIRDLPEDLKKAFKATLEELYSADILLHIIDISHPDFENHIKVVEQILEEMNLLHIPKILVFNKIDLLENKENFSPLWLKNLISKYNAIPISAKDGTNLDLLIEAIENWLTILEREKLEDSSVFSEKENLPIVPQEHKFF
jgi:GTP-binding protein HflX